MKKLVPATRSISCRTPAASSGGNASSSRNDVTNCAQTKNGRRMKVRPFARSCTIVTMKLTEPSSDEVIRKTMPISHIVWPAEGDDRERRVGGPARLRRAARHEEAASIDHAADEIHPVAHHVELGERHVGRADLQRHHEVAETADGERDDAEEHHDGAVHRAELVVELRQHDPARGLVLTEQVADERNRRARIGQLPPHDHHQAEAEEQEEQGGDRVLDPDHLVVDGEDVLPPETQLVDARARHGRARHARGRVPTVVYLSNAGLLQK